MPWLCPLSVMTPCLASRYTAPLAMVEAKAALPSTTNGRIGLRYTRIRMTSTMRPDTSSSRPSMPLKELPKSAYRPAGPATCVSSPGLVPAWLRIHWTPSPSLVGSLAENCTRISAALPSLLHTGPSGAPTNWPSKWPPMAALSSWILALSASVSPPGRT